VTNIAMGIDRLERLPKQRFVNRIANKVDLSKEPVDELGCQRIGREVIDKISYLTSVRVCRIHKLFEAGHRNPKTNAEAARRVGHDNQARGGRADPSESSNISTALDICTHRLRERISRACVDIESPDVLLLRGFCSFPFCVGWPAYRLLGLVIVHLVLELRRHRRRMIWH
jgi:hypothetical protein